MKKAKPLFTKPVTVEQVWASSALAFRVNGAYYKYTDIVIKDNQAGWEGIASNAHLAHNALMHTDLLTDDDHKVGNAMRQHFKALSFKAITKPLSNFEKRVIQITECNDWNNEKDARLFFAVLLSLPASYKRDLQRHDAEYIIATAEQRHIGNIKERININIKVIGNVYSKKWETYYITAITEHNNIVYFAFKEEINTPNFIHIKGTVKAHQDKSQTQLNRVKIIKES